MGKLLNTNAKKLENGNTGCPKCEGESFRMIMHLDGTKTYSYQYACANCGENVMVEYERDAESSTYWED